MSEIDRLKIENDGLRELVLRLAAVIERTDADLNEMRYLRYLPIGYRAEHALAEISNFVPVD